MNIAVRHLSFDYRLGMIAWITAGVFAFYILLKLRRRWTAKPRLKRLTHFGLSVWLICALLTGVELYFATIYDQSDSFNMTNVSKKWFTLHVEPDEKALVFSGKEGVVYRDDREFPTTVPAGQHHLCFLGDSFTFGHGVPDVRDRFSNRVRAALEDKQPGGGVVSNLAKAGTDLYWVEGVLEQLFARKYKVDTVIYVMCLNDIETFHPDWNKFYEKLGEQGPKFFLFRDTYFFNFLYFRYRQFTQPAVRDYYGFVREYFESEPWEKMQRKLLAVRDLCHRNGTDFRVVVFPFLHTLGEDDPFQPICAKVATFCRNSEIPVLDLTPVLTPHTEEGLTVSRFDAHPNERAHELAAEAILSKLLSDSKDVKSAP